MQLAFGQFGKDAKRSVLTRLDKEEAACERLGKKLDTASRRNRDLAVSAPRGIGLKGTACHCCCSTASPCWPTAQAAKAMLEDTEPLPSAPPPKGTADDLTEAAAVARIKDSLFAMFAMPTSSGRLFSVNQDQLAACVSTPLLCPIVARRACVDPLLLHPQAEKLSATLDKASGQE